MNGGRSHECNWRCFAWHEHVSGENIRMKATYVLCNQKAIWFVKFLPLGRLDQTELIDSLPHFPRQPKKAFSWWRLQLQPECPWPQFHCEYGWNVPRE